MEILKRKTVEFSCFANDRGQRFNMNRKIMSIILCLGLFIIPAFVNAEINLQSEVKADIFEEEHKDNKATSSTISDYDPLVDISVTVDIQKIRSLEKNNRMINLEQNIDSFSNPDFYVKVTINDEQFTSPVWKNTRYIEDCPFSATLNVPDDEQFVNIKIELWDKNIGLDKRCDISSVHFDSERIRDSFDVDIIYDIKTGHWRGDDFNYDTQVSADVSGYGRLNGCDDGSAYEEERDVELWFDIYQTDYDHDGIPYWTEKNVYGTNPKVDDRGRDDDNDGVPIEWEWKFGHIYSFWRHDDYWIYDPFEWEDHQNMDIDQDGLDNVEEYLTWQWGSNPFRKDIFMEIDQMEIGPNGEGTHLPELSKDLLKTAYRRQNIVLHIDDGCFGGGQTDIPFDEDTSDQELKQIYHDYFLNGDKDYWRKGVFHYTLLPYHSDRYPGFVFRGDDQLDCCQISMRPHEQIPTRLPILFRFYWKNMNMDEIHATVYAGAIMHETGHTLGIFHSNTPGCDDQIGKKPWHLHFWKWHNYKSVMNYAYVYRMVDYSDGSRGRNDFDDWDRIDLTLFQN